MKTRVFRVLLSSLFITFLGAAVHAQNDTLSAAAGDRYVISAKAGGVNFVEGTVNVARKSGRTGPLLKGDSLEIGDRVLTGADGKAEILLNPGSFLRLGGQSEFAFKTTSLDNLKLKVDRGSAILEVYAADEFKVTVATPSTTYSLIESGVFRIDVPSNSSSRLRVWKGVAKAGTSFEVKPGRSALVAGPSNVTVTKFDRDERDALDLWSRARSKELAKVTSKLRREDLRATLMGSFMNRRWDAMSSFGLWLFDPRYGSYFFLPFGGGWNSPYGYGYGPGMGWWWDSMPWYPWYPTATPGGTPTGGGTTGSPTPSAIVTSGDRSPIPPFIRMEQIIGGGLDGGLPGRGGNTYDSVSTSPSYSTPTYSPPSSSSSAPSSPPSTGAKSDATGTKP